MHDQNIQQALGRGLKTVVYFPHPKPSFLVAISLLVPPTSFTFAIANLEQKTNKLKCWFSYAGKSSFEFSLFNN